MLTRYHITAGASTTAGGKVMSGSASKSINGARIACAGDPVSCPQCHATGVIEPDGPRLSDRFDGRQMALSDDLCRCKCNPPPRLVANQTLFKQIIDADWVAASAGAAALAAAQLNTAASRAATGTDGVPLVLLDPETQEPFRHRPYRLELGAGTITGTTDQNGATRPLTAEERASFVKWHVGDANG
jgi:uncharacterized Zn-binding protein involved in type VI secretion